MSESLRVALAQLDLLVGDVQGNLTQIVRTARTAQDELRADLTLLPELALCGYPPEDLLFHRGLRVQVDRALEQLCHEVPHGHLVVGLPEYVDATIAHAAPVIAEGRVPGVCPGLRARARDGAGLGVELVLCRVVEGAGAGFQRARPGRGAPGGG